MGSVTGSDRPAKAMQAQPGRAVRGWLWMSRKMPPQRLERALRLIAVVAFLVVAALMVAAYPSHVSMKQNPGYLDNIFGSRATVFAARLLVVEAGIFLGCSMLVRTLAGEWATKAGPIDTDSKSVDALDDAVEELASWKELARSAEKKAQELEERLRATEKELRDGLAALEAAEAMTLKALLKRRFRGQKP